MPIKITRSLSPLCSNCFFLILLTQVGCSQHGPKDYSPRFADMSESTALTLATENVASAGSVTCQRPEQMEEEYEAWLKSPTTHLTAAIVARADESGYFKNPKLCRSSGSRKVDAEMLKIISAKLEKNEGNPRKPGTQIVFKLKCACAKPPI